MRIRLDAELRMGEIAPAICGVLVGVDENYPIRYITTDTKECLEGDLFFALVGEKYDGSDFLSEASKKGALTVSPKTQAMGIIAEDTRAALRALSKLYISKMPNLKWKIGITGSVGKTTTKEFSKILSSQEYKTHATEGNLNNEIGLPFTLLTAPIDTEVLICEMGMNRRGEISKLSKCLEPNVAIILNVGTSHIGLLGSRDEIARAKLEISDGLCEGGVLIVYGEEKLLIGCGKTFSLDLGDFALRSHEESRISFLKDGCEIINTVFPLEERHLKLCLTASLAIASTIGVSPENIKRGISLLSYENTRQKILKCSDIYFLADYYNASYESIIASLDSLDIKSSGGRKSVLLGDVLELGEKSLEIHKKIGEALATRNLCEIYLFGEFSEYTKYGAVSLGFPEERIHVNENLCAPEISAMQIRRFSKKGETILAKASRAIKLERVLLHFDAYI